MSPPYTAVIAVFNGERYVRRAVESALGQDIPGEIIVVNDGSSDRSAELVRALDPRIRVIDHASNRGISAARNTGVAAATAPILAFLDSDDAWEPQKMRLQLDLLRTQGRLSAAFCDFRGRAPNGAPTGWQGGLKAQMEQRGLTLQQMNASSYAVEGPVRDALIQHTSFMHPSTMVVRKSVWMDAGGFDPSLAGAEDLDAWIRLAERGNFGYVDAPLTQIEVRPDSLGHQLTTMTRDMAKLYSILLERHAPLPDDVISSVQARLAQLYADLGWMSSQAHDYSASANYYARSLKHGWKPRVQLAFLLASLKRLLARA